PETKQSILILDLKSGWWAGDGASFFQTILGGISLNCKTSIKIEYHHITLTISQTHTYPETGTQSILGDIGFGGGNIDFAKTFAESDWNNYNQIWLLSGAAFDPDDLPRLSGTFQGILTR